MMGILLLLPLQGGIQENLPTPQPFPGQLDPESTAPNQQAGPGYPAFLPRFDLDMRIDPARGTVTVRERVLWTHPGGRPTDRLVFNAHARFLLPKNQMGAMAKTLEILRLNPDDALGIATSAFCLHSVRAWDPKTGPTAKGDALPHTFEGSSATDLVVHLPQPVKPGEVVGVDLEFTLRLDPKQGRWGQWKQVVYLMQWLPVPALFDSATGWNPVPFLPWHQPFANDSGHYTARITLPEGWNLATSGTQQGEAPDPGEPGWKRVMVEAQAMRDFSLAASPGFRFLETTAERGEGLPPVKVRVAVLAGHEAQGERIMRHAVTAISTYSRWLGAYPWPEFTLVESFFGWNGNEAGSMVFLDQRVFNLPELADGFVEYLVIHETCHQWWYNAVGTDGFHEPFLDEGLATAISHKLLDTIHGRDHHMLNYPTGFGWMPNIPRTSYRAKGWSTLAASGHDGPVQQSMEQYGNLAKLFGLAYDKSSKVFDMIADRLGEQAYLEFLRMEQRKYRFRVMHMADFERDLTVFTGQDWGPFFDRWMRGPGHCDWAVESVRIHHKHGPHKLFGRGAARGGPVEAVMVLARSGSVPEDTTVGIRLPGDEGYSLRLPVSTEQDWESLELGARTTPLDARHVKVTVELATEPEQISVDPDQILPDLSPHNNHWKRAPRLRGTWLYTALDENDLTTTNDQVNLIMGPWLYGSAYSNAWYTRSTMAGVRAGAYRTQDFSGGIYAAYRTDYRDVILGADGLVEHWPDPSIQTGFNVEQRVYEFESGQNNPLRASLFARKVLFQTSSLYLLPFDFLEGYGTYSGNFLPFAKEVQPGAVRFQETTSLGMHYRMNRQTPYWDPQFGWQLDAAAEGGQAELDSSYGFGKIWSQASLVQKLPDFSDFLASLPGFQDSMRPFFLKMARTRLAVRAYAGTSAPSKGLFFPMGGSEGFRGFSLAQRQGSTVWVGSAEWRIPLVEHMETDFSDHVAGLRTIQLALFYDVGDAYANGRSAGAVAHGVGVGIRFDTVLLSFVERAMVRFDFAQAIDQGVGPQFWFGITQPF